MTTHQPEKPSGLITALREGVALVQMVVFKTLRTALARQYPESDREYHALLAGALTSELFGANNPGERFAKFRREHRADIEQALLSLGDTLGEVRHPLTDALRIQALCDHQEGADSTAVLIQARQLGVLIEEREVPLPSAFMTAVRQLGSQYQLVAPPLSQNGQSDATLRH
jgi:hypothetical protein